MTPKEKEILNEIKKNPSITQGELADILNISRSTVASHIKNLSDKGYILGRCYVVRDIPYITVIGAANMDIIGSPEKNFIERDSNIGTIYETSGGVGRNICENLARLNLNISFISIFGKDERGKVILDELEKLGVDSEASFKIDGAPTSVYMAILDEKKDMYIAVNQMQIVDKLTPELISTKRNFIESSLITVLDTNLSEETLKYILNEIKQHYYVDAVSVNKCIKIKKLLDKIYFLKANKKEAEYLSDVKITDLNSCKKAAQTLMDTGLKTVCITLGENGVLYADNKNCIYKKAEKVDIKSASGAGDAFMAAYIYSNLKGYDIGRRLDFASAASRLTLKSPKTISENLSVENIEEEIKNVGN